MKKYLTNNNLMAIYHRLENAMQLIQNSLQDLDKLENTTDSLVNKNLQLPIEEQEMLLD